MIPNTTYINSLMQSFKDILQTSLQFDEEQFLAMFQQVPMEDSAYQAEIRKQIAEKGYKFSFELVEAHCQEIIKQKLEPKLLTADELIKQQHTDKVKQSIRSIKDILANGIPEVKWRVDKLIPERGVVILGGASGSYKTWAAMSMACSIASGNLWFGKFPTKQCPVLYIDEENGDIVLPSRFDRVLRGMGIPALENLYICSFQNIKIDTDEGCELLYELINLTKAKVVIIDSLVRCMEGEEDKAVNVRNIFDFIKNRVLCNVQDVVFPILHHTLKDVRGRDILSTLRGSGDLGAFCDTVLLFKRQGTPQKSIFSVDIAKNRHIDLNELPGFSIEVVDALDKAIHFQFSDFKDTESALEKAIKAINAWIEAEEKEVFKKQSVEEGLKDLAFAPATLNRALKKMVEEGSLIKEYKKGFYSVPKEIQEDFVSSKKYDTNSFDTTE